MRLFKCLVPVLVLLLVEGSSAGPSMIRPRRDTLPVPQDNIKNGAEFIGSTSATANYNGAAAAYASANSQVLGGSSANAVASATANAQAGLYAKDGYYGPTGQQPLKGSNQLLAGPGQFSANAVAIANAIINANAVAIANAVINANAVANANRNAASSDTNYLQRSDGNGQINKHPGELLHYVPKEETLGNINAATNADSQDKVNLIAMKYLNQRIAPGQLVAPQGWRYVSLPAGFGSNVNKFPIDTGNVHSYTQHGIPQVGLYGNTNLNGSGNIGSIGTINTGYSSLWHGLANALNLNINSDAPGNPQKYDSAPRTSGGVTHNGPTTQQGYLNIESMGTYNGAITDILNNANHIRNLEAVQKWFEEQRPLFLVPDGSDGSSANRQDIVSAETLSPAVAEAIKSGKILLHPLGSSGGLSSAISKAHSNTLGGSANSSSMSTANGSGIAMAQSSSNAISTDGRSSASGYASASANTSV